MSPAKNQHNIRRAVIRFEPLLHILHRGGIEVRHLADRRPGIRMAGGIRILGEQLAGHAVGLVLALPFLVLHHTPLQVERFLVERSEQVPHAVGLHPEGKVDGRGWHVLEVVGAIGIGCAIQIGCADAFHGVDVASGSVLAAAEHQVLKQVRKSRLSRLLVFRANVIPDVDGDDRGLVIFVDDHGEAVVEDKFLVGDLDLGGLRKGIRRERRQQ